MGFLTPFDTALAGVLKLEALTNIWHVRNLAVGSLATGFLSLTTSLLGRWVSAPLASLRFSSIFAPFSALVRLFGVTILAVLPLGACSLQMEKAWDFGLVTLLGWLSRLTSAPPFCLPDPAPCLSSPSGACHHPQPSEQEWQHSRALWPRRQSL